MRAVSTSHLYGQQSLTASMCLMLQNIFESHTLLVECTKTSTRLDLAQKLSSQSPALGDCHLTPPPSLHT